MKTKSLLLMFALVSVLPLAAQTEANDTAQQIYDGIYSNMPIGLEYGLAGIGYGTTILYKRGLVDCD